MTRYIDADKLWNDRPQIPEGKSQDYGAGFSECMWGFSRNIRKQIDTESADVVPKSEVDWHREAELNAQRIIELEAELDDFTVASLAECKVCGEKTTKVIADLQEKLSNAKAEVAREIFEEIEQWFNTRIDFYEKMKFKASLGFDKEQYEYAKTFIANLKIYRAEIAELEKKYMEE